MTIYVEVPKGSLYIWGMKTIKFEDVLTKDVVEVYVRGGRLIKGVVVMNFTNSFFMLSKGEQIQIKKDSIIQILTNN